VTPALLLLALSGIFAGAYTVLQKLGSSGTTPALGAMVVAGTAFAVNLLVLLATRSSRPDVTVDFEGLKFLVFAGVAAAAVDLLGIMAYGAGVRVTSGFIVTGLSAVVVLIVGFLGFRDPLTLDRVLAIAMIVAGVLLLSRTDS
jgi:uncharacterized membrane protein